MKRPLLKRLGGALGLSRRPEWTPEKGQPTEDWKETTDGVFLGLDDLLKDDTGAFASTLRVISLAAFRDAVGEDWERLKDRVMMIAESMIQRRIGTGNVYGRQGEEIFVLCFATSVPDAEARRKAIKITEEIGRKLIGAQFSGAQQTLVHQVEVDKAEALTGSGTLNLDVLAQHIEALRACEEMPDVDAGERFHISGSVSSSEAGKLHQVDRALLRGDSDDIRGRSFMSLGDGEAAPEEDTTPKVEVAFRPLWNARDQAVNTCIARAVAPAPPKDLDALAAYDAAVTTAVLAQADKAMVIAPVHFSSVAVYRRAPLVAAVGAERSAALSFLLQAVPSDAGLEDMLLAVKALRGLSAGVFAMTTLEAPRLEDVASAGASGLALNITETEQLPALKRLIARAADLPGAPLPVCVFGLDRPADLALAVQAGAALVGGKALMPEVARPGRVLALSRDKFLAALMAKSRREEVSSPSGGAKS